MKLFVFVSLTCVAPVVAGLMFAQEPANTKADDEVMKLTGTWTAAQVSYQGQVINVDYKFEVMLTGRDYTVLNDGKVTSFGRFRPVAAGKHKGIDISITQPMPITYLGIYELNGDTLKVCFDVQGGKRPSGFDTPSGSNMMSATYKRNAAKK